MVEKKKNHYPDFHRQICNVSKLPRFLLNEIYQYILTIAYSYGVDIEDGLEKNIAKLKKRYPEKFDENLAVNRDLETERKILEGGKISN